MKWEYLRFEYDSADDRPRPERELNIIGSEGWELVSVFQVRSEFHYYFKRLVQEKEKKS